MPGSVDVSLAVAAFAGLISFLSPCVLALVPVYITYLAGTSLQELADRPAAEVRAVRAKLMANSAAFVLGLALVFIGFGMTASALGRLLFAYQVVLRKLGGLVVVLFGLHLTGLIRIPWLTRERRWDVRPQKTGPGESFLIGMAFSAGWTPCIGPILASILLVAGTRETVAQGGLLLAAYSAGLAVPFLLTAWFLGSITRRLARYRRHLPKVSVASGVLVILLGIMVYQNTFARLAGLIPWPF